MGAEPVDRLELERGDLADEVARPRSPRKPESGAPMFPGERDGPTRAPQHLGDPGRRRRLAVGSRDGDPAVRARRLRLRDAPGDLDLGEDRDCPRRARRRAPARVERHARRDREPVGAGRAIGRRASEEEPRARAHRSGSTLLELARRAASPTDDRDAAREQRLGERPAAAGETEHRDAPGNRGAAVDGRTALGSALIAASTSRGPTTAKRIARIQNRMMTRDSAHPSSSKWWWSGAILKTRSPGRA